MKIIFSVFVVILMLAALCVSVFAAKVDPNEFEEAYAVMHYYYWTTYLVTPISEAAEAEIETAWAQQNDDPCAIVDDRYYYGDYNGTHVFLYPLPAADITLIEVGGQTLMWGSCYQVNAYRDGQFMTLPDAYEQQWLNDDDITHIALLADCTNLMKVRYLGYYDDCYVGFVDCPMFDYAAVETVVTVGGFDFVYPNAQQLLVCRDGEIIDLSDAYEAGWLSDSAVARLWNYYTNGVYEGNPNTDDGVWSLVTLLMSSGAALMMLVVCKRKYSV